MRFLTISLITLLATPLFAQTEQVQDTQLPLECVRAFPNLRLERPIVFLTTNDGTDRLLIASQLGKIHSVPYDQSVTEDKLQLFMDIETDVVYSDKENEEGLLGFALHPKFKENGEFFIYRTKKDAPPHTSVVSRFRADKSRNQADPATEEEIMRIPQPYWNHNGGGLVFGPDGYLYISLGDGGARDDPHRNGQNLKTLLGKILRIDVDHKDSGKKYAIPKDNPFVGEADAQPEIWAYGLRNVWGMAFDPANGTFWAADVGQDLWEEIDIIVKGGNYGWNLREGKHKFMRRGADARPDLIEPVLEYHHEIGKSITGGVVYRGKKFPELEGCFLYADYITGRLWALKYDEKQQKVIANYRINDKQMPIIAFGVGPDSEVYMTDSFGQIWTYGRGKS